MGGEREGGICQEIPTLAEESGLDGGMILSIQSEGQLLAANLADGSVLREFKFEDLESALAWLTNLPGLVTEYNFRSLDANRYVFVPERHFPPPRGFQWILLE